MIIGFKDAVFSSLADSLAGYSRPPPGHAANVRRQDTAWTAGQLFLEAASLRRFLKHPVG